MAKPSRKHPPTPSETAPSPKSKKSPAVAIGLAGVVVVALAVFAFMQTNRADPIAATPPAAEQAAASPQPVPAYNLKPHTQKEYPPLQLPAYANARSQQITAAYRFAAEHPEVLSYVPCFCGCERGGHRGNEDCFVKTRAENGDVTEWEPHGMECQVCLDVATQASQMFSSGASVRDIRAAVEKKWAAQSQQMHTHTPTPDPPAK